MHYYLRNTVAHAHPRGGHFKKDIIQAFYDGIKRKPDTTFGNLKGDVLGDRDPTFERGSFCRVSRDRRDPPEVFSKYLEFSPLCDST